MQSSMQQTVQDFSKRKKMYQTVQGPSISAGHIPKLYSHQRHLFLEIAQFSEWRFGKTVSSSWSLFLPCSSKRGMTSAGTVSLEITGNIIQYVSMITVQQENTYYAQNISTRREPNREAQCLVKENKDQQNISELITELYQDSLGTHKTVIAAPSWFLLYHSYSWITFLTELAAAARLYDGQAAYVCGLWITP